MYLRTQRLNSYKEDCDICDRCSSSYGPSSMCMEEAIALRILLAVRRSELSSTQGKEETAQRRKIVDQYSLASQLAPHEARIHRLHRRIQSFRMTRSLVLHSARYAITVLGVVMSSEFGSTTAKASRSCKNADSDVLYWCLTASFSHPCDMSFKLKM